MATQSALRDRRANGIIAGLIVVALVLLVGSVLWKYMGAFFLAVTAYVFFNPLYLSLRKRGFGKTFSGWATLIIATASIALVCYFTLSILANEIAGLLNPEALSGSFGTLSANISKLQQFIPGFDPSMLKNYADAAFKEVSLYLRTSALAWMGAAGEAALSALIIIFTFYYLLVAEDALGGARAVIPFSRKNTDILIKEFKSILYSSIICTGLMALVQTVPLVLVFMYFNVPGAIILGFIAAVLTCIPFTGIPFVWIPVAALELLSGNYPAGIGIVATGLVIAGIENFRPVLQNRIGEIHPLVALLGVIIGVVYFGILGLLIGPILLSFTLLTARMFKEEYL